MPRHRRAVAAAVLFAALATVGAVDASAAELEVRNCATSEVSINVDVYNGNDAIRAIPFSSASGLGRGQSRTLTCATDQCQAGIDFPSHVRPPILHGTTATVYGGGVQMKRRSSLGPIPSSRVCFHVNYDANGDYGSHAWVMSDGCSC